jgi:hypothetical protein
MPASVPIRPRAARGTALLVCLIALAAAGKAVLYDTLDPDTFLHLLAADQLLTDGIGPLVDHQSFASVPQPWTPYSWLAELAMKVIWDAGGYRAAIVVHAVLAAMILALVAAACVAKAPAPDDAWGDPLSEDEDAGNPVYAPPTVSRLAALVATAFAAYLSLPYFSFRPVTAVMVILAACLLLLVRDRRVNERSRSVWLVIPLTVLAVNLHLFALAVPVFVGSFFLGAVWERRGSFEPPDWPEAERRARRYALLLAGTLVACLATPMIQGFPAAFAHMQTDPIVTGPVIAEYQPFYRGGMGAVGVILLGVLMLCTFANRSRLRTGDAILLLVTFALLMRMNRFAPVFAVASAPIFAMTLPRFSDRLLASRVVWALTCLVIGVGVWRVGSDFPGRDVPLEHWVNRHGPDTPGYPCEAAAYVEANVRPIAGRLINEYTWGGYLEWRFRDRFQSLLDGRTQCFSSEFWRLTYLSGHEPRRDFLARVKADAAILPVEHSTFHDALAELGWTRAYSDERAEVLIPPTPPTARAFRPNSPIAPMEAAIDWTEAFFRE